MGLDYTTSFISLATALSLAGWATFPGPQQQNGNHFYGQQGQYNNIDLNGNYNRFQPYARPSRFWDQQQQYGANNMFQQPPFNYDHGNFDLSGIYQTKDAQQNFQSVTELQDLVSWQDASRRGDVNLGRNSNFILPVMQKDEKDEGTNRRTISSSHSFDDGYLTGDASIHSPSSVFSSQSTNLDELNLESLESPVSIESNDLSDIEGAIGGFIENADFDIDNILFGDNEDSFGGSNKNSPVDTLNDELDFAKSAPLKSPTMFDQFLASPNPEYRQGKTLMQSPNSDPFQMQVMNTSNNENKAFSNGLGMFGDIDPSVLDDVLSLDDEINVDKILTETSTKNKVPFFDSLPNLKEEFSFGNPKLDEPFQKPALDERNGAKSKIDYFNSKTDLWENKMSPRDTFADIGERTFAPTSTGKNALKGKYKKQQSKKSYIWPNFPYTYDELIEMPVETFNEVIKTLDDVQQHEAKDIRRKGKNKLAARNCRKRKMEVIDTLDAGVSTLEQERARLYAERQSIIEETRKLRKGTEWLNNYIFEHLRDSNGSPYSPTEYSLQYTSDGNVYLVPSGQARSKTAVN